MTTRGGHSREMNLQRQENNAARPRVLLHIACSEGRELTETALRPAAAIKQRILALTCPTDAAPSRIRAAERRRIAAAEEMGENAEGRVAEAARGRTKTSATPNASRYAKMKAYWEKKAHT
jgi:hypothetical protein